MKTTLSVIALSLLLATQTGCVSTSTKTLTVAEAAPMLKQHEKIEIGLKGGKKLETLHIKSSDTELITTDGPFPFSEVSWITTKRFSAGETVARTAGLALTAYAIGAYLVFKTFEGVLDSDSDSQGRLKSRA